MSYKKLRDKGSIGPFPGNENHRLASSRAQDSFMAELRPGWQDNKFARIRQWRAPNQHSDVDDFPLRQSRSESDTGMFKFRDLSVRYITLIDRERHQVQMIKQGELDDPE